MNKPLVKKGSSWLHLLLLALAGSATFAVFSLLLWGDPDRDRARSASCRSNLKQIGLGILQYAQDYDERYPPVEIGQTKDAKTPYGWADTLYPYTKSLQFLQCPGDSDPGQNDPRRLHYTDYWFNGNVAQLNLMVLDTPAKTIMSGDGNDTSGNSDSDEFNITDARYALTALPPGWLIDHQTPGYRHLGDMNLLFTDGHVKALEPHKIVASSAHGPSFALE